MSALKHFIEQKMRMSHVYQPVMIQTLLKQHGKASVRTIATSLLAYDSSQIEYYENVTKNMVGKVLRSHEIVQKKKDEFILTDYGELSPQEIDELIILCQAKIETFIENRKVSPWEHRRKNRKPVNGSVRYKVLKRAKGRCELCGISAEHKALEVDHITPKNLGGEDHINNYQALCYTCNAQKRDTDDESFRGLFDLYNCRVKKCVFCKKDSTEVLFENNLAKAFLDQYPVTEGHLLIVPKRHCRDWFELMQPEVNAINDLIHTCEQYLRDTYGEITGSNIGINNGASAGQTIFHAHIHLIPRRKGDVFDATGGVRGVIPDKANYLKASV